MESVDLTQPWNDDCPSRPTYPNPNTYHIKREIDDRVNGQMLEMPKFLEHPGLSLEFVDRCLEMEFEWFGIDNGSTDHPMNGAPRSRRPDIAREAEDVLGEGLRGLFPEETYHTMHDKLVPEEIVHAENGGGDIEDVLNERATLGCFPWRMVDVEASPRRTVAFGDNYTMNRPTRQQTSVRTRDSRDRT